MPACIADILWRMPYLIKGLINTTLPLRLFACVTGRNRIRPGGCVCLGAGVVQLSWPEQDFSQKPLRWQGCA
jgi:hypothetical protein